MNDFHDVSGYRGLSLWLDELHGSGRDALRARPGLTGPDEVDVAVVGAGYTGLWTAYYLTERDPSIRVIVLEAEIAGFGASGRNGGWCSALFPTSTAGLARRYGRDAALAMRRAMNDTVTEVGRVAGAEGIDCDYRPGGTVRLARSPAQLERARAEVAGDRSFGGVDGVQLLDRDEALARVGASDVLGGTFIEHCARVQPAALVRGLAEVLERRGVRILEHTPVLRIEPASPGVPGSRPRAITEAGVVRADRIVRATEAWTAQLPGSPRAVIPLYSLMIATEPLPESFWQRAGLHHGETFSDHRNLIIYGQRTARDRLAFGGRGAPYHLFSQISGAHDRDERVFGALRSSLTELFPDLAGHAFTHCWGGPLGVPRDWQASVGLDPETGLAWAGGYVGDGVGTSNLAGRTLADLITGADSELVTLPWVGHRSRRWEPEPLRWLGVNAGLATMRLADREEELAGRGSLLARAMGPLLGH